MERFAVVGLALGAAAVFGGVIYMNHRVQRKRREGLEQAANEMRWSFSPERDEATLASLSELNLFSQGHSKRVTNVMRGKTSHGSAAIFDYTFTVGGGKNQHTESQTVLWLALPGGSLPRFALRPEQVWHKLGSRLGYQDIDFDRHPEFSKRYLLRGEDEPAVRKLFSDRTIMFFEGESGICVEGGGGTLIVYRSRKRVKPEEIRAFLETGARVASLLRPQA